MKNNRFCKTIYKKDSKGNYRYLTVNMFDDKLQQISGITNTSNPIIHEKICKPKNIGKSNETSGNEQAYKEAEALIKDKLTKGYFETIEEAQSEEVILPMLAKDYKKESHKIDWDNDEVITQPKYDGMRALCHCRKGKYPFLMSRDGKIIENMDHILKDFSLVDEDVIFDGELYCKEDFQTNMTYIKKYRKDLTEQIKFNCYDVVLDKPFLERVDFIEEFNTDVLSNCENIIWVTDDNRFINSEEELKEMHQYYLSEGYEGTMIRINKSGYKINGRSSDLLKYKDFLDIDCKIISIGPAESRPDWGRPVLEWNGKQFSCGTKMSHEARKELLTNADKYIGKTANIRYFELSNTGVPRFPIMIGIHEDR